MVDTFRCVIFDIFNGQRVEDLHGTNEAIKTYYMRDFKNAERFNQEHTETVKI